MRSVRKPWWQQATALVTVSTGGVITGFNFVPGAATTMTSPTSVPLHLLALEQAAQPGTFTDLAVGGDSAARVTSDAQLRAAIVNVAGYYLRLAKTRTPAQMEALIWDNTSSDGTDHGESCAAFASLTLELAAQAVGQQSWVTGGDELPVAAARVGRRAGGHQPGVAPDHVRGGGRAGARPLASARRRLPARSRATGPCTTATSRS